MNEKVRTNTRAGFLRRLAAFFYDCLLLTAIYFVIGAIAVGVNDGESIPLAWSLLVSLLVFPLCAFFFYCWFWRRGGQTLGMQAWRIKLISDVAPLPIKYCAIRFLTSLLSLAAMGTGFLWMLIDRDKRAWQDMASKSWIVVIPR